MSLLVHAYVRTAAGEMQFIEPEHPSQELAGFESYRRNLYGGQAAQSLGLKVLPCLAARDIYAEGEELEQLRLDAERALSNIELFEAEAGATGEHLRARFENILSAVQQAQTAGGGVVIW